MTLSISLILLGVAVVSLAFGWILNSYFGKKSLRETKVKSEKILLNARNESENFKKEKLLEAQEEIYTLKQNLEEDFSQRKNALQKQINELHEKDSNIDRKADLLSKKERDLANLERDINNQEQQMQLRQEKLNRLFHEHNEMLEKISGMTAEEAKTSLMNNLADQAREDAAKLIHTITEEAREEALKRAQNIILTAIQQSGTDVAIESTVSVVNLPADDMKGRIIGREGRNIRAFEVVTGVDVIVDDTPGTIILSGFDPYRREIARILMEKLVADGRIHPGRIEDMYEKIKSEMTEYIRELGEQALLECGVHGVHPDLVHLLGKLRYRTSFGQNVLQHSKEVAILAGIMAAELGLDVHFAKRAGILHDIGRAVERTTDVNHAQIGFELTKKYNENAIVQNAIQAHHGGVEQISPISVLVQVANEISLSRPGARREVIENFVQRMKQMEAIAESFEGVTRSCAIQAGKEVRVIVSHEKIDDMRLVQLAKDIAKKIEEEIEFPGQVKIVVIREFRGIGYA